MFVTSQLWPGRVKTDHMKNQVKFIASLQMNNGKNSSEMVFVPKSTVR